MGRSAHPRAIAYMVWAVASIFYAYQYILRVLPNIMLEEIMQQFRIDAATFGQFSGVYYLGYALMHLPIGLMLDRYGPRKIMTVCIVLTVIGLLPLMFATHWFYSIIGRLLIGVGSSAAILGVFKVIRLFFAQARFSRYLSVSVMIGLIGAIYGGGPISYFRERLGYQPVVGILAAGGILLALVTFWLVPEVKEATHSTIRSDIKEVLRHGKVIWCSILAGLMVGPLEGFADVWGTAFLKGVYGLEGLEAASLPSTIFLGMCFGAPLLNFIAEKIGNYLLAILAAGIVMTIIFFTILFWQIPIGWLTIGFVLVGIACAYQILAIYKASTYVRERLIGLTTAVANMIIMIFGYAFHSVIGGVVDMKGGTTAVPALISGVAVIPIALTIGCIGFLIMSLREKQLAHS